MPKKQILIVEDNETLREQLAEFFSGEGYPVVTAVDGSDALTVLRSMSELPGIIFLDLMMPVLDGQGFLNQLQNEPENQKFSQIAVAIVSAARTRVYGDVVANFGKPPSIDELMILAERYAGDE